MGIKNFFKKLIKIIKEKPFWKRIEFCAALIFVICMFSLAASVIGWWTVITSIAIGIMYDDIKGFIIEVCNKNIDDEIEEKS